MLDGLLKELLEVLLHIMEENTETLYARIHTSSKSTADYTCASYGGIF